MGKVKRILECVLLIMVLAGGVYSGICFYLAFTGNIPPELTLIYLIIGVCLYSLGTHYFDYSDIKKD